MIQSIVKAVRQVTSKIWPSKKYNRINWQNRPSTATALGATNLNKIDVFCNEVDNALIQIDAGKLDIATANSMLASVSFNQDTGTFTFKELDGTTYTYDLNLEKIPVSFSLSEDGILTMTTEDGTQWTCNIADLIKDYVFDDSDTIAFEKEFVEEDDEGKGSYHVTASVKAGSINENHLNPDYRADIQTYKNQAQTAANDSLTYSKDSKRWAVGDAEYEGSATDNSKYYKEQAEAAKAAAEQARDEAQAATGAVIMTPEKVGVGKPDNQTIGVESDGTIKLIAKAASLLITDNQELVVDKIDNVAQETTTQLLIDAIAQKVANELVTNSALTTTLANYVTKAMMSNVQVNDQNKVPTSSLAFSMNQAITELNSDFQNLSDENVYKGIVNSGDAFTYIKSLTIPLGGKVYIGFSNECTNIPTQYSWWAVEVYNIENNFVAIATGTWAPNDQYYALINPSVASDEYEWKKYVTNADFATGTARIQTTNGEVSTSQISFGKTFSSTPKVFCNIKTSVPSNKWVNAGNISTTGFTIYADVDVTGTITVDWFAVAI